MSTPAFFTSPAAGLGDYPEIRISAADHAARMAPLVAEQFDHVLRVDDLLCAGGMCQIAEDGQPLYFDSNHPSLRLNALAFDHLSAQMRPLLPDPAVRN